MIAFLLLLALVFTLPWEKSVVIPGVGTLTKVLGAAAALAALPRWREFRLNAASAALLAFISWSAVTWAWSLDREATLARALTYVQLFALFLLVSHEKRSRALMLAYTAGAAVAAGATIARYLLGQQTYWRRYAAPGFDPNDLGITVALAIPLALYAAPRWLGRAAVVLYLAAILLTASRTALIASIAALLLATVFWRGQRLASAALLLLLIGGATMFAPEAARQRIATTTTEIRRGTLHSRTVIWKAGLRAWRSRPVTGAGAGAYPDVVRPLIGVPGRPGHEYVAHNVFLSVLVETGIVGLALFGLALALLALFVWALRDGDRLVFTAAAAVWLAGAVTLTWEHRKPTWLLPALICSMWVRSFREEGS